MQTAQGPEAGLPWGWQAPVPAPLTHFLGPILTLAPTGTQMAGGHAPRHFPPGTLHHADGAALQNVLSVT